MVNEKRLVDEFKRLAAYDSESFYEKEIAEYLTEKLKNLGLEVSVDDAGHKLKENEKATGNIYGYLKGNVAGDGILLSAHMDTVAPGIGKEVIVHQDGKVTSNGKTVLGADDISGIVTILEVLEVITENDLKHPDIEVVFFIAEEPYCRGSSQFDFSKVKAKLAYVFDLDGEVGRIANSAPSIIQLKIEITGKSSHAGFAPEKGISAIMVAAKAISGLKLGRIDEKTTANLGTITGGTGKNIVPEKVIIEGEVRSMDDALARKVVNDIISEFETSASEAGASVDATVEEMISSYHVKNDEPVIKRYTDALNALGYGDPVIISTFGGSDNNYINKNGIQGIVVSNAMNSVHTVNEFFYIDELVKSTRIALKLVTE